MSTPLHTSPSIALPSGTGLTAGWDVGACGSDQSSNARESLRPITDTWKRWIAENKMLGTPDSTLIEALGEYGFDEAAVVHELAAVAASPYFQAGCWMAQKLNKYEALSDVRAHLSALSPRHTTVDRRYDLSRQEFLDNYYAANRPVVLAGAMREWNALSLWDPLYLRERCGHDEVEIMSGRDSDPHYQINSELHKSRILFRDFVDKVLSGPSNDYYLLANSSFFDKPDLQWMLDDIGMFPECLNPATRRGSVFFWFGPAGTVTPLHHDKSNILFTQVYGSKRVTLISPDQSHLLYNEIGVFSRVDCEDPDYESFPLFRQARPMTVELHPGEALFIPVGWWHHVRALEISINVSFLNFAFPNRYEIPDVYVDRDSDNTKL